MIPVVVWLLWNGKWKQEGSWLLCRWLVAAERERACLLGMMEAAEEEGGGRISIETRHGSTEQTGLRTWGNVITRS